MSDQDQLSLQKDIDDISEQIKQIESRRQSLDLGNVDMRTPPTIVRVPNRDSGIGTLRPENMSSYKNLGAIPKHSLDLPTSGQGRLSSDILEETRLTSSESPYLPYTDPVRYTSPSQQTPHANVTYRRSRLPQGSSLMEDHSNLQPSLSLTHEKSSCRNARVNPAKYDGTGSWIDYQAHFEACATLNRWTPEEKGLNLAVALRGQAQGVLGNLRGQLGQHYDVLVKSLEERFSPPNQTELYRTQLKERRQRATETLPELAQDIRRLTNLAYNTVPSDVKETLAK